MQKFMAEDLFGKLLAIVFVAIILAALAGTSLQAAINYFFAIAGMVFGVGAVVAVTIVLVFRR